MLQFQPFSHCLLLPSGPMQVIRSGNCPNWFRPTEIIKYERHCCNALKLIWFPKSSTILQPHSPFQSTFNWTKLNWTGVDCYPQPKDCIAGKFLRSFPNFVDSLKTQLQTNLTTFSNHFWDNYWKDQFIEIFSPLKMRFLF